MEREISRLTEFQPKTSVLFSNQLIGTPAVVPQGKAWFLSSGDRGTTQSRRFRITIGLRFFICCPRIINFSQALEKLFDLKEHNQWYSVCLLWKQRFHFHFPSTKPSWHRRHTSSKSGQGQRSTVFIYILLPAWGVLWTTAYPLKMSGNYPLSRTIKCVKSNWHDPCTQPNS